MITTTTDFRTFVANDTARRTQVHHDTAFDRPACEPRPAVTTRQHTCHIEHLPHLGKYRVYCDHGCDLGTSASTETLKAAAARAEIHETTQRPVYGYVPGDDFRRVAYGRQGGASR